MGNNTTKKQRLNSFIENIAHISDESYQERVWIKYEGPECEEIDDAVCDFFDDGDPILEKYEDFGITENQYESLIALREKLDSFIDEHEIFSQEVPAAHLIKLPEWKRIMNSAQAVLKAFDYKKE